MPVDFDADITDDHLPITEGTLERRSRDRNCRGYPLKVSVEAMNSPFEKDSSVRLDQVRVVPVTNRIHSVLGRLHDRQGWHPRD